MNGPVIINGKIKTKHLFVTKVSEKDDETIRKKRENFESLDHPKITVKSINGADWNQFISNVFRVGIDTEINGS